MNQFNIPARLPFRFSIPCLYQKKLWVKNQANLDDNFRLPDLTDLESPGDQLDFRIGWNEKGIAFRLEISGKKQTAWCRISKPNESDGLHIWIDTRNIKTVHRASQFCKRFYFLPSGDGPNHESPCAGDMAINRAREKAELLGQNGLMVESKIGADGYILHGAIAAESIPGFDPEEHPEIGFNFAILDRELGTRTLGPGSPMPYTEDPSLWPTLSLTND
jgi:hypothetical protein